MIPKKAFLNRLKYLRLLKLINFKIISHLLSFNKKIKRFLKKGFNIRVSKLTMESFSCQNNISKNLILIRKLIWAILACRELTKINYCMLRIHLCNKNNHKIIFTKSADHKQIRKTYVNQPSKIYKASMKVIQASNQKKTIRKSYKAKNENSRII